MILEVNIENCLSQLLTQEDTDQDKKITIEDKGPKAFNLVSIFGESYTVSGTYHLSNLLQELVIAKNNGLELASKVSTKEPYYFGDENATYKVSALDIGIKKNILRNIAKRDVYIKVFPYNATFEDLESFNPA